MRLSVSRCVGALDSPSRRSMRAAARTAVRSSCCSRTRRPTRPSPCASPKSCCSRTRSISSPERLTAGPRSTVGQVAERNNRILVTTVSYAPSITGAQCNANVFRVNANAFMQSNALTSWLTKNVSGKRYFFIGPDYEMGRSTVSAFQDDIKRLGGTDVGSAYPPLGAKDFTPYVGQIRSARPDVIMTATAGNDTVRLLTQLKEYGILANKLTLAGAAGAVT